jgi:hypothetical protein
VIRRQDDQCVFKTHLLVNERKQVGERTIQAQLGIETKIHSIETPGLYVTILRGVEFTDPEIGTLFKTVEARIEFGEINQIYIPYKVQNLTNQSLTCLIENLNRHLIRSRSVDEHWRISFAEDATIEHAVAALPRERANDGQFDSSLETMAARSGISVSELQIDIGPAVPAAAGTFANARFKLDAGNSNEPSQKFVECRISRTEQYGHRVELDTNDYKLPCWLMSDAVAYIPSSLGPAATFTGTLALVPTPLDQYLNLQGSFENVDLMRSVLVRDSDRQFATIKLNQCRFERGDLEEWDAILIQDLDGPPKRIWKEDLFTLTKQVDPTKAIATALLNPRPASAESETYRR